MVNQGHPGRPSKTAEEKAHSAKHHAVQQRERKYFIRHHRRLIDYSKLVSLYMTSKTAEIKYSYYQTKLNYHSCRRVVQVDLHHHVCDQCGCWLAKGETSSFCCQKGAAAFELPPIEEPLRHLYSDPKFASRAREYNNLFRFCAVGFTQKSEIDEALKFCCTSPVHMGFQNDLGAPAAVSMRGQTYHYTVPADKDDHRNPIAWALWDADASMRIEQGRLRGLDDQAIHTISNYLQERNRLSQTLLYFGNKEDLELVLYYDINR